ncbi:rab geranylgeranyltransferase [Trametes elegans]|nr:rab geranylgeranyltransferase [Trametes elegans]
MTSTLDIPLHVKYIQSLGENKDDLVYHLTAHLRMNAIYWGLTALCVMKHQDALNREEMIEFVMSCWDDEAGAFGAHPDHDAHLLSTLSAIQILIMQDALDRIDVPRVAKYILSLQQPSGVFAGDSFGEIDTRFLYCAVNALSLLGYLHELDVERTVGYIRRCRNFDGGFGAREGAESHAAHVFVCVAALAILDRLDEVDEDMLSWWLAERQVPNGGLNGRPEKLEDVCYSFWVLSAMSVLNKLEWINSEKLIAFILSAQASDVLQGTEPSLQDLEHGGISDRPGDQPDVFHTQFGVAGKSITVRLSILGYPDLEDLDPVYCMPAKLIEARGLRKGWKALPRKVSV